MAPTAERKRDEAKRKRAQRIPSQVLRPPKPPAGVRSTAIDQLKLNGERGADLGLRDAALDVEVELTMVGASTLRIPVHDPERVIGTVGILDRDRDGLLDDQIILEADGLEFSLVRVEREAPTYTLTFESLPVSLLRWYDEPRKAYRGRVTRAEFLWSLVREVQERKLRFYSPELRDRQPMAAVNLAPTETEVSRSGTSSGKGFGPGAGVTVKGRPASALQRNVIAGCLAEAERLGASAKVMTAVVMCIIQESGAGELAGIQTGNDDVGIFQQGRNWISVAGSKDPAASTRAFLTSDRASSWKKVHGSLRNVPGGYEAAIKDVQISVGGYQPWAGEAAKAVAAFTGGAASGNISSGRLTTTKEVERRYAFTRGQQGRREDSWACGTRLSEELAWRWFELAGTIVHASDEELIRQRPAMSVWEGAEGIDSIGWTVDRGRPADEATIECRAKAWGAVQGQVVELVDEGPATGKWLVESVSGSLLDEPRTVTLSRPQRKKPEPAPETRTLTSSRSLRGRSIGGAGSLEIDFSGARKLVESAFRIARAAGGEGVYVASAFRPGDPKDHGSNDADKAARDIAVQGIDALVGPPSPKLDRGVVAIGKALGRNYGNGTSGPFVQADNIYVRGFRVQVIWRTPEWGGHMGHIHIGCRRE